ncbi:hypothetical protein FisN_15Lu153 [Fistulifera solaris]|uniref:Uncharacterized protein n=1 Tax=Fistulifera solaris TaxID=1519565 RepID=A0A1Z5KAX6_FISSO|nr:hypothetical protein FisN_15Lu153 [Fistulifera solaris]|eukprot:GAX23420.1 hypothetical protein FisN_15Lu153 [Fistulifera solaris]
MILHYLLCSFPWLAPARTLLLLAVVISHETAFVQAQGSCSAAQENVPPFEISGNIAAPTTEYNHPSALCGAAFSESDLPPGDWYSYFPKTEVALLTAGFSITLDSFPPNVVVFEGTCESLSCVNYDPLYDFFVTDVPMTTLPGSELFIYVFSEYGSPSYTLTLEEYSPPPNDKLENAVAITQDDLPFQGVFSLDGALSDFEEDGCGIDGKYGVWFTYTSTFPEEPIVLKTTVQSAAIANTVIGVQARVGDSWVCEAIGFSFDIELQWIAKANVQYYILIGDSVASLNGDFEVTLQSRGVVQSPTFSANTEPAASPSVSTPVVESLPGTSGEGSAAGNPPVAAPASRANHCFDNVFAMGLLASFFCFIVG